MELIKNDLTNISIPKNIVACIGEFDGVHIAHQKLLSETVRIGIEKKLKTALITFDPHPDFVLNKKGEEKYLTPLDEKINYVNKEYDLDYFIVISFSLELSRLSEQEFYNKFLSDLDTIIVGYDFKFGYKGKGNSEQLKKYHYNVIVIEKMMFNNEKIGSKSIIENLGNGKLEYVNTLLGRFYKVSGVVTKGAQIGATLGYPTANIILSNKFHLLRKGVYAVRVNIDGEFLLGIANYGENPSFNKIVTPRLEVHIFEYNNNLYDKILEVEFLEFIRDEMKFSTVDLFLEQLERDCKYCISKYGGKYETINCRSNG